MKVISFWSYSMDNVEEFINEWLKYNPKVDIFDTKLTASNTTVYAMIMYNEVKDVELPDLSGIIKEKSITWKKQ